MDYVTFRSLFYTTYISVDLAHYETFRAKVVYCIGGIKLSQDEQKPCFIYGQDFEEAGIPWLQGNLVYNA